MTSWARVKQKLEKQKTEMVKKQPAEIRKAKAESGKRKQFEPQKGAKSAKIFTTDGPG
jgi:hypothetical protein